MNRQDYIYQLVGKIVDKKEKKKKDGSIFYQLSTVIPDKKVARINVFGDSCKKEIWQKLEKLKLENHLDKKYLLYCKNYMGSYFLVDWKELEPKKNHGSN